MLKPREFFTDTCFSHSYVTLFPSGAASFWYTVLFISDHRTIPVVVGLLESTVRNWQDVGNWSLGLNPLRRPNPYSQGDAQCQTKPTRGTCTTVGTGAFAALPGFEARSGNILMHPSVPPRVLPLRVWETLAQKAAPAPTGSHLSGNAILRALGLESAGGKSSSRAGAHFSPISSDGRVRQRAAIQPAVELGQSKDALLNCSRVIPHFHLKTLIMEHLHWSPEHQNLLPAWCQHTGTLH